MTRVFTPEFYDAILHGLKVIEWEQAQRSFYRQREKYLNDDPYFRRLFCAEARNTIAAKIGQFFQSDVREDFDVAAHKMIVGDYIAPHTDRNKLGERYRCAVTLNASWDVDDGGVLLILKSGSVRDLEDAWLPTANNGYVFETGDDSYHAVSPIRGERRRYSLILTFKERPPCHDVARPLALHRWWPFPLRSDVEEAAYNAEVMGVSARSLGGAYESLAFSGEAEFRAFLKSPLRNAPPTLSYSTGKCKNVDEFGRQTKGSDAERIASVAKLLRIPPICLIRRVDGSFLLVNGSHRLSYAVDQGLPIQAAVFEEVE